jgi:hypothetical protein
VLALLMCIGLACQSEAAEPMAAPRVRPWTPPQFDSLQTWAAEARAGFRRQPGDAIDSTSVRPYDAVGAIAGRWINALGRTHTNQVRAVEDALDSLGFDTEIAADPVLPGFTLLMVRNPFRITSHVMAFLFWFRGTQLREQALELDGGLAPQMRVWWVGDEAGPYEWALVHRRRGTPPRLGFMLFRLDPSGAIWRPLQYDARGPDLGTAHEASFNDVNGDGRPELVTWSDAAPDSLFEPCTTCPRRLVERLYVERHDEGFIQHDSRLVPNPYSIFELFVHLLIDRNREGAARLLQHPEKVAEAIDLGWGSRRAPGTWKVELAEEERWPRWLQLRFRGPRGAERFVVRFTEKDGRWIIDDWKRAATAKK